jgi:hypothetical protein
MTTGRRLGSVFAVFTAIACARSFVAVLCSLIGGLADAGVTLSAVGVT